MSLPFFYTPGLQEGQDGIILNEETSRHVVQVLRMKNGEPLQLTNGAGHIFTAAITDNDKRKCAVAITAVSFYPKPAKQITIAISLLKNAHRFEWFLEKAVEIGVSEIVPLMCDRTEKQHFRIDRMNGILISALLQSQQSWLPLLHAPVKFSAYTRLPITGKKFIAHCEPESKQQLAQQVNSSIYSTTLLIGPEGDFTKAEIEEALQHDFIAVALGDTRLRTETAGVVAATLLKLA